MGNALGEVSAHRERLRIGVLRPFRVDDVASVRHATVSDDPSEITQWRGKPLKERASWHTVVIGYAGGPLEAGLQSVLRLVTQAEVLARWEDLLLAWADTTIA